MKCLSNVFGFRARASIVGGLLVAYFAMPGAVAWADATESRIIYMVIQAEPQTTEGEIKDKFNQADEAAQGCAVREVLIEPIDPQTYTILRGILQRGLASVKEVRAAGKSAAISPVVGMDSSWSIDLGGPFEFIESVTVSLSKPESDEAAGVQEVRVTGSGSNPEGYALRLHSPGRYVLTLPKGVDPRSIGFEVTSDDGQAEVAKRRVDQAWPAVGRAYLVTLADVVGDESSLFAALKDPTKVSNPIREIQDATKASLMVASFVEVLGNRLRIENGRITLSFPVPLELSPKRLWLMFPLTAEELVKEKRALEAVLAEPDGFIRLHEVIRSNAAKDQLVLGRSRGWVELPIGPDGFTRVFDLDLEAWKNKLAAGPDSVGDNALLVYEFDNGPGTVRVLKMEEGYVVTDRIAEWLPALRSSE